MLFADKVRKLILNSLIPVAVHITYFTLLIIYKLVVASP